MPGAGAALPRWKDDPGISEGCGMGIVGVEKRLCGPEGSQDQQTQGNALG